ncbi:hypothetical protein D4764_0211280 [Takifugu flavidus]|uniref:Uncharacterized protein n=1 Tax=Takifugu flavidus TaxID=433684 RepID=A0A5C6MHN8_9TELE|nr:hypothetical protein D4764_0211280 [Takifugu flavidus]
MPKPPQLTLLNMEKQRFYSELLPDVRAFPPFSKVEPGQPVEETHFDRLYPRSRSFSHHPTLMAIDRLSARVTADADTKPPVDPPFHTTLTREQDPEILELLHLRQDLLPDPEKALYLFLSEDHGL